MLCLRCGAENQNGARLCGSCGAILPRNAVFAQAMSHLDLKEGKTYDKPDRNYPNVQIDQLETAIIDFLNGQENEDKVYDLADQLEETAAEVLDSIPRAVTAANYDKQNQDEDELRHLLPYLLSTGAELLNTALSELDAFLSGEPVEIEPVMEKLRESNNYLCHSANIIQTLFEEADAAITKTD
ncbi:MAG TPA: zinc ribbon domain-containing protein [Phycisphaerales bacterium]|nr:zinc ribbon domain-containing protein [Phycisphaerales bacterium]